MHSYAQWGLQVLKKYSNETVWVCPIENIVVRMLIEEMKHIVFNYARTFTLMGFPCGAYQMLKLLGKNISSHDDDDDDDDFRR